jgi:soluble lytic murein transglycosylase
MKPAARRRVVEALTEAERTHRIDAILLLAVIEQESGYRIRARSPRGARGLMQVRPATARQTASRIGIQWGGPDVLYDPVVNIRIGTAYLAELKQQFGRWDLTLAAYHQGPRRVRRLRARGLTPPSAYSRRVMERYEDLGRAFVQYLGREAPG